MLASNSPGTKIILMSATLDIAKFQNFFKIPIHEIEGRQENLYPPIIDLCSAHRKFTISEYYLDNTPILQDLKDSIDYHIPSISQTMYNGAARLIALLLLKSKKNITANKNSTNILVFLPGLHEIECFQEELENKIVKTELRQFNPAVHVLHSSLSTDEQKCAFKSNDRPKIILSTNIAESSVTLPNVVYVIDFCLTKVLTSKFGSQMSFLVLQWASRNNCKQRSGRTGRVQNGSVYRLVSRDFYCKKMREHAIPEIRLIPLESVVIKIKKLQMGSPLDILAVSLDPPDESKVVDAVLTLKEHGGLFRFDQHGQFQYDDGDLTFLGEIMSALPCDVRITKLIVLGYLFSVLDEAIIIGAGLNLRGIFSQSMRDKMNAYAQRVRWSKGTGSDCIAIYYAYTTWINNRKTKYFISQEEERGWCIKHGLDLKNLNEMRLLIDELHRRLRSFNIQTLPSNVQPKWHPQEKIFILKVVISGAFGVSNFFFTDNKNVNKDREAIKVVNEMDLYRTVYFRNMDKSLLADIYKQQLKDILVKKGVCKEKSEIRITFDYQTSERVFITFDNEVPQSDESFYLGKIVPEVYKSVKLRQMERSIVMKVMSHEESLNYAVDKNLGSIGEGKFEFNRCFIDDPEFWPIPTSTTNTMKGIVTYIDDEAKFYFRPRTGYCSTLKIEDDRYEKVLEQIQTCLEIIDFLPASNEILTEGKHVVFRSSSDSNDYDKNERARFRHSLGEGKVKIDLIDRGFSIEASIDEILCYKNNGEANEVKKYSSRIFVGNLKEIQPSYFKTYNGKWTPEAIHTFRVGAVGKKAHLHIFSVVDNVVVGSLSTIDSNGNFTNWNKKLIEDGYAEECDESYVSKLNHQKREYLLYRSTHPADPKEEFSKVIDNERIQNVLPPPLEKCKQQVTIIGPISPLETALRGISKLFVTTVKTDQSSINCVLLDDEFTHTQDKFYVAANITCNARNENILVRETTVMPNLPGLSVILALIFAPYAEIRRNKEFYRYESVLTGLGYDVENKRSYFTERDAFQPIEFDLTPGDLHKINCLRNMMSNLLFVKPFEKIPDFNDASRAMSLSSIQQKFLEVINKKYILTRVQSEATTYDWQIDQFEAIKLTNTLKDKAIFDYFAVAPLYPMSDEIRNKLIKYARNLECPLSSSAPFIEECKLCGKTLENHNDLKIHLLSKMHINRKKQLGVYQEEQEKD